MNGPPKYTVEYMLALAKKLHDSNIIACCLTCEHFDEPAETCTLYQQRPPARVIAYGCPSWQDEMPF